MTTPAPNAPAAAPGHPAAATGVRQTLLVLGASGDLTGRLLLPGLGRLVASGALPGLRLIGSGMDGWDDERWRRRVADSFATVGADGPVESEVVRETRYVPADVTREDDLRRLLRDCAGPLVIFFALPPMVTARSAAALARIGVPPGTRLMLEKPFGVDRISARSLNNLLDTLVPEDQVHRIDHFLGKSTVLNLLGLRFANRIFEPVLNAAHVACVDIVFDETLGLEGRAGYYDGAGALVDMVQSHLLQVLALLTMDPPPSLDAKELRGRAAQVLRATRLWRDDPVAASRRARYTAGEIDGRRLPDYADEPGVDPTRGTETLAELVLTVDTWRWAGVPFRLRSGKATAGVRKEAVVTFKQPARVPAGLTGYEHPDRLRIGFGPDRLGLELNINGPGDPFELDQVHLTADFGPGDLPAYGEVLRGAFEGDPLLSVRGDVAEECWRVVEPVLAAWRAGTVPLQEYRAGSAGPVDTLLTPVTG
ncbi:glucose-6-phosphate dehydrogenase [Micromonospora sp. WMMD1082]|uniref:glucose-6-phosphate dehydrogenase n=1 Tax=Micromonospora sp. WMMD1082 TaxID=3016104 RepID=UPI002418117F|nr:glucose-6-phosphate dehydrogenase [Micromonospora sp. WMMD1082]MDG4798062.1 glucose-6-phosphate dehydrogenase [Micromonospora sp. WMMD1082]